MKVQRMTLPEQRGAPTAPSARGKRPVPTRNPEFAGVDLAELRRRRTGFTDEESRVSYWRRIIQARLDLLSSESAPGRQGQGLARVLADSRSAHRRIAALSLETDDQLPPLPDLAELWARVTPDAPVERDRLAAQLRDAERRLSEYRHELHTRIDSVTAELIARYRENPTLALTALNERLDPR